MSVFLLLLALASAEAPADLPPALTGAVEIPGIPPGPRPTSEDEIDRVAQEIGLTLRCPVCQGLSVADSTSPTAVAIQRRIRELVAMGYDEWQIKDYFVVVYGDFILLEPRRQGLNWLIWLGPGIAVGLGLAWAASMSMKMKKEPTEAQPAASQTGETPSDPYEARLLAELED